jgi:hypothetical protein
MYIGISKIGFAKAVQQMRSRKAIGGSIVPLVEPI